MVGSVNGKRRRSTIKSVTWLLESLNVFGDTDTIHKFKWQRFSMNQKDVVLGSNKIRRREVKKRSIWRK